MPAFFDEFENKEKLILRDHLALERTKLANERTLFSYLRTGLYLLTAGIGIFEIKSISHLEVLGWIAVFTGAILLVTGLLRFLKMNHHLNRYREE